MSTERREWLSKWGPLIVAVLSNVALVSYGYGKLEQRIAPIEVHVANDTTERALKMFVSREEWDQRNRTRDAELSEIKAWMARIEGKVDRLLERK